MELKDKSTKYTPEEIAAIIECDESFDDVTRALYCSYHIRGNNSVEEVVAAAEKTAAERLEKRLKEEFMPDDISALYIIAERAEANMVELANEKFELSKKGPEDQEELEQAVLAAKRSRVYRERKAHEAIRRKLLHEKTHAIR